MRKIVALKSGIPENEQRIIYKAKVLKDEDLLTVYVNQDGETLHLVQKASSQPNQPAGQPAASSQPSGVPNPGG